MLSDLDNDSGFWNALLEQWGELNPANFTVQYIPPMVFVCGGPTVQIAESLRERVFRYSAEKNKELFTSLVVAENFKDYFKQGAYADLMQFEDDIANISTLIVIFLESAGSLVELGLFVNKTALRHRLLVFVPAQELEGNEVNDVPARSSFIFLGPLESLRRSDETSVCVYPWPEKGKIAYPEIEHIVRDIDEKLRSVQKTEKFHHENTGHMAMLIFEIILLSEPIKITEIEWVVLCLEISLAQSDLSRLLYLLEAMGLISSAIYSKATYYYARNSESKLKFGRTKKGKIKDAPNMRMAIIQSYIKLDDKDMAENEKKRRNVLSRITNQRKEQV